MSDKVTSIRCKESTVKELRSFEIHPREPHEEIILRLIKKLKKEEKKK